MEHFAGQQKNRYRLMVVGDGMEREIWERYATKTAPGQVMFMGHTGDRSALADLYANADVFVHPNPREPFGIAPLEAMASAVAVVVPNEGGVLAYANDQNAWTAAPTIAAFAEAVARAAGDTTAREAKTRRALRTAERYRWENVAAEFLDLYAEFCRTWHGEEPVLLPDFSSSVSSGAQKRVLHLASVAARWAYNFGTGRRKQPGATEPASGGNMALRDRTPSSHLSHS